MGNKGAKPVISNATLTIPESQINADTPTATQALAVAAGYMLFSVACQIVSSDWLAQDQAPTADVTVALQEDLLDGSGYRSFASDTYPNNAHDRHGNLPGFSQQWDDGRARNVRALITVTKRMRIGGVVNVVTE
jgi:hypothetical protein